MPPQRFFVKLFVQLSNTDSVFIRRDMLRHNIHCHLAQIHIRSNACCGGYTCSFQHVQNEHLCKATSVNVIKPEIARCVNKDLVDRIGENILW